jgi:hypothetical protein
MVEYCDKVLYFYHGLFLCRLVPCLLLQVIDCMNFSFYNIDHGGVSLLYTYLLFQYNPQEKHSNGLMHFI